MAPEPDEDDVVAVALPSQLTQVHHAVGDHVGGPGVADVGVVRPHDRPRPGPVVIEEAIEGVHHVVITDVPALPVRPHHRPVIPLRTGHDLGVLTDQELLLALTGTAGAVVAGLIGGVLAGVGGVVSSVS